MKDVLGAPGRRKVDALALLWAHQISWAAHTQHGLDEVNVLSTSAERYHVPLHEVLDERKRQQVAPPVVPAARPQRPAESTGEPEAPEKFPRLA